MALSEHGASGFSDRVRTFIRRYPRTKAVLVRAIQASQSLRRAALRGAAHGRESLLRSMRWLVLWPYSSRDLALHNLSAQLRFRLSELRLRGLTGGQTAPAARVSVRTDGSIPMLAWIASGSTEGWLFTVGQGVELHDNGVFEGVWDGDFDSFRPDACTYAFGSGAVWVDGPPLFVPPRHLEECLFALHRESDGVTFVGNSLPFLFTEAGVAVGSPFFERVAVNLKTHAFEQGRRGVDRVRPLVAADSAYQLYQCSYFNFFVDSRGRPDPSVVAGSPRVRFLRGVRRTASGQDP